jgi:hypothetical protein
MAGEVDVTPAEGKQLAASQAGQRGHEDMAAPRSLAAERTSASISSRLEIVVAARLTNQVTLDLLDRISGDDVAALRVAHDRAKVAMKAASSEADTETPMRRA